MKDEVKAGNWQLSLMEEGFKPDFREQPEKYSERNNMSAVKNMDVVRKKVEEWRQEGFVEKLQRKATCNSPLTVSDKVDPETGKIKKRVCLDLSRHVNKCLNKHHTNLEDLAATACLYQQGDYMCVFDLENQYFHVQLAPEVRQFFGFSIQDQDGTETAYQFKVMIYGFAAAAAVVTRLIKPLQGYLHNKGIRTAIYMDDGQVVGATKEVTAKDMKTVLQVFQRAGWNIQWTKTVQEPRQDIKYLGFHVMLENMEYVAAPGKEREAMQLAGDLEEKIKREGKAPTREVARVVGKLVALRASHGPVLQVATRNLQCKMGVEATANGWDGLVELGDREESELSWIKENLQAFNGRGIRDETGENERWTPTGRFSGRDETGIEEKMQRAGIEGTAPAYILRDD